MSELAILLESSRAFARPILTTAILCASEFLNHAGLEPESKPGEHRKLLVRTVKSMLAVLVQDAETTEVDLGDGVG